MTITNGYATLDQYKAYQKIQSTNTTDDTFIELVIESASRWIDEQCNRRFYQSDTYETHYFDVPSGDLLMLDMEAVTIASVTNGDGNVIASANYVVLPYNGSPKTAIQLVDLSSVQWKPTSSGNRQKAISVSALWGAAATAPTDIVMACLEIARALYKRRMGENTSSKSIITAAGVVILPEGAPEWAAEAIANHRRVALA